MRVEFHRAQFTAPHLISEDGVKLAARETAYEKCPESHIGLPCEYSLCGFYDLEPGRYLLMTVLRTYVLASRIIVGRDEQAVLKEYERIWKTWDDLLMGRRMVPGTKIEDNIVVVAVFETPTGWRRNARDKRPYLPYTKPYVGLAIPKLLRDLILIENYYDNSYDSYAIWREYRSRAVMYGPHEFRYVWALVERAKTLYLYTEALRSMEALVRGTGV